MTTKEQIIEMGKILAYTELVSPALVKARNWWRAGAVSRYSHEDIDIAQSMLSELSYLKRNCTLRDDIWQARLEKAAKSFK